MTPLLHPKAIHLRARCQATKLWLFVILFLTVQALNKSGKVGSLNIICRKQSRTQNLWVMSRHHLRLDSHQSDTKNSKNYWQEVTKAKFSDDNWLLFWLNCNWWDLPRSFQCFQLSTFNYLSSRYSRKNVSTLWANSVINKHFILAGFGHKLLNLWL